MRITLLFLCFVLFSVATRAQIQPELKDSLWNDWNNEQLHDSTRFNSLNLLTQKYLFTAPDTAFNLADTAFRRAEILKNYKEQGKALKLKGVSWAVKGNYDSSFVYFTLALEAHEKAGFKRGIAIQQFNLANIYISWGDTLEAMKRFAFCEEYYLAARDTLGIIKTSNIRAGLLRRTGKLDSAITASTEVLNLINHRADLYIEESHVLLNRGEAYEHKTNYSLAIKDYQAALAIGRKNNSNYTISLALGPLANILADNGENQKAMEMCNEAILLAREMNALELLYAPLSIKSAIISSSDSAEVALPILNELMALSNEFGTPDKIIPARKHLINYYILVGEFEKALEEANKNEDYLKSLGITNDFPTVYADKASCLLRVGRAMEALPYAERAMEINKTYYNLQNEKTGKDLLSVIYESLGRYEDAFQMQKDVLDLEKKILSETNERTILKTSVALEYEKEAFQDSLEYVLKEEVLTAENTTQKKISYLALGGLFLFALFSFFLFRSRRTIAAQKEQISISLNEKDTLLREIHHRVKNNLQVVSSLLRLQTRSTSDEAAIDALTEGQSRVQSMSLIHQNLYQKENLTGIKMRDYLANLSQSLFDTYKIDSSLVQLELDIQDLNLDVDTVVPLGLIINELMSNSLKYAFPGGAGGKIKVSLNEVNDHLLLVVADDGIGISTDVLSSERDSFGFTLIQTFTKKLKATLDVKNDNGARIEFTIRNYSIHI